MASIVIAGDTSGSVTLAAPAVAGTTTLTLPATSATLATLTTPSFATTIGVGGATASASGSGITFPASFSNSSDAQTLDDYEEGTFTPTLGGNTTYTTQVGRYTKLGNTVTCVWEIQVNTLGTGSTVSPFGFPFAESSGTLSAGSIGFFSSLATSVVSMTYTLNGTYASFHTQGAAGASQTYTAAVWGNGARIIASITYRTAT